MGRPIWVKMRHPGASNHMSALTPKADIERPRLGLAPVPAVARQFAPLLGSFRSNRQCSRDKPDLGRLHAGSTPKDYGEGIKWLGNAAKAGCQDAQTELAKAYRDGMGVEANLVKAYVWFSMAARQELADIRNIWAK